MRIRNLLRSEDGMSLVELLIASVLTGIIATASMGILVSVQNVLSRSIERSTSNDEVRLATEQLDREVRSGSLIFSPDTPYSLRVLTRSNNIERCVQYTVKDREFLRRDWPRTADGTPPAPDQVSGWRTVATSVVNEELEVPIFTTNPANSDRTVEVTVLVNPSFDRRPSSTVRVDQSLTARNTAFGLYGPDDCVTPA